MEDRAIQIFCICMARLWKIERYRLSERNVVNVFTLA